MNKRTGIFAAAALLLAGVLLALRLWPIASGPGVSASVTAAPLSSAEKTSGSTVPAATEAVRDSSVPTSVPVNGGVDAFAPALIGAKYLRQERRMFQAQTWEPELAKAFDLQPGEWLERRSGVYELADFRFPKLRVDRIYRRGGANELASPPTSQTTTAAVPANSSSSSSPPPSSPTAPLDNGGGRLAWSNAMVADHLMVQAAPGISREQMQARLPTQCNILEPVTNKGLYLVSVPDTGDRALERAVLALNQLKSVIAFAEPDFAMTSADATPTDPLFTASATDLSKQWHLAKTMAPRAWDVLHGPPFATTDAQYTTRLNQTVVAIVDTGFDYTHPDLAPAEWLNPGESGGGKETNNLDDDNNGYKNDWHGWDFIDNDNDPMDDVGHGTHVAGLVGAVGNNGLGGSGVCWNVKLLNLRIIKKSGAGTLGLYSGAIAAMNYLHDLNVAGRKIAVANHSWGGAGYSQAMLGAVDNPIAAPDPLPNGLSTSFAKTVNQFVVTGSASEIAKIKIGMTVTGLGVPAKTVVTIVNGSTIVFSNYTTVARAATPIAFTNAIRSLPYGVVHVAAAGNSRYNADRIPTYPACLPSQLMLSVGASDASDHVSSWTTAAGSNYGALNVDIFAPGTGIWSTFWKSAASSAPAGFVPVAGSSTQGYLPLNGTSMAAPQVSAAVALLRMWQPSLTDYQARQVLIDQGDLVPELRGKCASGARLNVARMLDKLYQPILVGSGGSSGGGGASAGALQGAMGVVGRVAIGATDSHNWVLAIQGGSVWAWGYNRAGVLGLGDTQDRATPAQIPNLANIIQVAAGSGSGTIPFSMALDADGNVWTWGGNHFGSLGSGTASDNIRMSPAKVDGIANAVWISAGNGFAVVVTADGSLWGWGLNSSGELGLGEVLAHPSPIRSTLISGLAQVAAGSLHALGLRQDGTVWSWGDRTAGSSTPGEGTFFGALGDGVKTGYNATPTQVAGLPATAFVAGGQAYSAIVTADGFIYEWGYVDETRAPDMQPLLPALRDGMTNMTVIAASQSGDTHHLAVNSSGEIWHWGGTNLGAGGDGRDFFTSGGAVQLTSAGSDPMASCGVGRYFSVVIGVDGSIYTFGDNGAGCLGTGVFAEKPLPVPLTSLPPVTSLAADSGRGYFFTASGEGYSTHASRLPTLDPIVAGGKRYHVSNGFTFLERQDGTIYAIGRNDFGQLGIGTTGAFQGGIVPGLSNLRELSAPPGGSSREESGHAAAVLLNGTVKTWGANKYGQLGDGSVTDRPTPGLVPGLSGIVSVATGDWHTLALTSGGAVYAWGRNDQGQLGDGTQQDASSPHLIAGLSGIVQIAGISSQSYALQSDGTVWAWGSNRTSGATGSSTYLDASRPAGAVLAPVKVVGLPAIQKLFPGNLANYATATSGRLWCWGISELNLQATRLLRGIDPASTLPLSVPAEVIGISSITELSSVGYATFALREDGSVYAWGDGSGGTLGDGDGWSTLPNQVIGFGPLSTELSSLGAGDISASWLLSNFSASELVSAASSDAGDASGDGISNLVKYALGLNPHMRNDASALPATRIEVIGNGAESTGAGGFQLQPFGLLTTDLTDGKHYQALTVNRRAGIRTDIAYIVEVSSDLKTWQDGQPFTITALDTAETLQVYDATPLESAPQRFMRLRLQRR